MTPRTLVMAVMLAAASLASGCGTPRFVIDAENARTNTHIVLAFEETVFNRHHVQEGFDRYVADDYKQHDLTGIHDIEAASDALKAEVTKQFPNSRLVVKRTVAQRDLVTIHAFWDQRPGEAPGVARIDIYRLMNSKIAEHWQVAQPLSESSDNASYLF